MTEIRIDRRPAIFSPDPNETLEQTFQRALLEDVPADHVICDVLLNGAPLSPEEELNAFGVKISDFKTIDFVTKSGHKLAFEALDSCSHSIDSIIDSIRRLVKLNQDGKQQESEVEFINAIERIDLFIQLISKVCATLKKSYQTQYNEKTISRLEIQLLSIVKGILPVKKRNDSVMLNDLLEYELVDNLTQWKIQAIPMLRNLQNQ